MSRSSPDRKEELQIQDYKRKFCPKTKQGMIDHCSDWQQFRVFPESFYWPYPVPSVPCILGVLGQEGVFRVMASQATRSHTDLWGGLPITEMMEIRTRVGCWPPWHFRAISLEVRRHVSCE